MTSTPTNASALGTPSGSEALLYGTDYYKPAGTRRYEGPALPPNGSPTETHTLEKLNERLERLAFGERPQRHCAPPLETYTNTPTEHGDVVRATQEYVRWFHRTYSAAGPEDRTRVPSPSPSPQRYGGETDLTDL